MTTTATHLRLIAQHWTDLRDALASTGTATWPPAGRMSDYLASIDRDTAELEEERARALALRTLERDPSQIGESRPPLRIHILDTMRAVEAALTTTADQVAAAVQRQPMPFAPSGWPAADRERRNQLARADAADPRRWRWTGIQRPAPYTALWLLARVQHGPGPFRPLPENEAQLIANVAQGAAERVERALDIAARQAPLAEPCPRLIHKVFPCGGRIDIHGGAGAQPVAHCTKCGHIWTGHGAAVA